MEKKVSIITKNHISSHYRIYSLLNRKGYSIGEVEVKPLEVDPNYIRMILSMEIGERVLEQARRYLNKIVDVVEVEIL